MTFIFLYFFVHFCTFLYFFVRISRVFKNHFLYMYKKVGWYPPAQLQSIQNRACRVIFGLKKTDSVDDKLKLLHWLKVQERVEFKILLLVFKSINGLAPSYLNEILRYNNTSGRRASGLHIPLQSTSNSFQSIGPKLWQKLPYEIRSCPNLEQFKCLLKTFLFRKSYDIC